MDASVPSVPSLASVLAQVPDPRHLRGRRHPWTALLLLIVVALLCGANTTAAIARWAHDHRWPVLQRLGFTRRGGPSQPTLHRLLRQVEVGTLEALLGRWLQQVWGTWQRSAATWLDGIAVDGKTLRGARRLGAVDAHLLSACCQRLGVVLGEVATPDATNELGALDHLLDQLPLAGRTVTFDALFAQTAVARAVVARGSAYLLVVKANQPFLHRLCAAATAATAATPARPVRLLGQACMTRCAHGRMEWRTLRAVEAPPDLGFPHAHQVLRLERRRAKRTGGAPRDETVYALTSLRPDQASPAALLELWHHHWWIENGVHWVRDVVFGEDRATIHVGHAPQVLAALRNLALSLLHLWRGTQVTAAREYYATHLNALFRHLRLPPLRL
jgi:predicted transposase YbfD/YdcC